MITALQLPLPPEPWRRGAKFTICGCRDCESSACEDANVVELFPEYRILYLLGRVVCRVIGHKVDAHREFDICWRCLAVRRHNRGRRAAPHEVVH